MAIWETAVGFGKCGHHAHNNIDGNHVANKDVHTIAYANRNCRFNNHPPHRNTPTDSNHVAHAITHADGATDNATNGRY